MEYTKEELECMESYHKMILQEILSKVETISDNYQQTNKKCDTILKRVKTAKKD